VHDRPTAAGAAVKPVAVGAVAHSTQTATMAMGTDTEVFIAVVNTFLDDI
jgi:hypothetical protein